MKTRLLLIAFLAFGSTTLSNAQKSSAAASRPFYDYFYLEGNFGFFSVDLINYVYMSNAGIGLKITPHHYLGAEFTGFGARGSIQSGSALGGWGLQYQYRLRKWYFLVSGGELDKVDFSTYLPFEYTYTETPDLLTYFRIGIKHCFWGLLCVGCQYAQSSSFKGYISDFPAPGKPRFLRWEGPVRSMALTFGFMLQNPPN